MEFDRRTRYAPTGVAGTHDAPVPGKQTLTQDLVQLHPTAVPNSEPAAVLAEPAREVASAPSPAPVITGPRPTLQMLFGRRRAVSDPEQVHAAAARGTATPASQLPGLAQIQRSFGRHDVSGVQAHVGGDASASARDIGAAAYATGNHVVLGPAADLHTIAHEAAHVIQQRGGVQLKGGVGAAGDAHEQHADAVASLVVQGKSAESLLDRYAPDSGSRGTSASGASVQRIEGYDPISAEMAEATWHHVALDPREFVGKRVPPSVVEGASLLRFILHRGQVTPPDGLTEIAFTPQDFPARYFGGGSGHEQDIHVFGLHGEDWFRQMLYMLGVLHVPGSNVLDNTEYLQREKLGARKEDGEGHEHDEREMELAPEAFDVPGLVATDLGPTLGSRVFQTVTIGMKGRIREAVERVLTKRAEPKLKANKAAEVIPQVQEYVATKTEEARRFDPAVAVHGIREDVGVRTLEAQTKQRWWMELSERAGRLGDSSDPSVGVLIKELQEYDKSVGKRVKDLTSLKETIRKTLEAIAQEIERYRIDVDGESSPDTQLESFGSSGLMQTPIRKKISDAQSMTSVKEYGGELRGILESSTDPLVRIEALKTAPNLGKDAMVKKLISGVENLRVTPSDLEMVLTKCKAKVIQHDVLSTDTGAHLLINIADAHGDMAYHVTKAVVAAQPAAHLNVLGTAGSLDEKALPPGSFVAPQGTMTSMEPGRPEVRFTNLVTMDKAKPVERHSNVSTLLREHDQGVGAMGHAGAVTMDMESYHVVRAIEESDTKPELRLLFRVSDVANSKEHGAQRSREGEELARLAQRLDEESAAIAMGLVSAPLM